MLTYTTQPNNFIVLLINELFLVFNNVISINAYLHKKSIQVKVVRYLTSLYIQISLHEINHKI
jgi:hypothetical protein